MSTSTLRRTGWFAWLLTSLLGVTWPAVAQDRQRPCGTDYAQRRLLGPRYEARWQQYRAQLAARSTARTAGITGRAAIPGPRLIIPVVIHIIHDGGASTLADEQIFDAIRILNEDFQRRNADAALTIPTFRERVGDVNVEFRLARHDPQGNCTNGITRTYSPLTNSADDNVKDLIGWDGTRYLNVWVVRNISFGAAGYAYLPCWIGPEADGIVILNGYIGSIGLGSPRNSRALTHEVGHYLGLPHTWGGTNAPGTSANCFDDDGIADTPNTVGSAPGICNLRQRACPGDPDSLSNVQNYMDYSYCSTMFTAGQADAMYDGLALNSFGDCHATLTSAANLQLTGVADGLNLPACMPVTAIAPAPGASESFVARGCAGDSVRFAGAAYNLPVGASVTWQWRFPGGQPATSTRRNPAVVYAAPGTYDVALTVSTPGAPAGTLTNSGFARIVSRAAGLPTPLVETFDDPQFPLAAGNPLAAWEIAATPSTSATWAYTSAGSWQGPGAVRLPLNVSPAGTHHVLTSPSIVLATELVRPVFTFRQAYAPVNASDQDRLEVAISLDCGRTWNTRQRRVGVTLARGNAAVGSAPWVPTAAEWHEERVGLGATLPAGTAFRVRFTVISAGGNALYLDDARVESQPVLGLLAPAEALSPLLRIVPNPSATTDGSATVQLMLPDNTPGMLQLYDATGRRLGRRLALPAGTTETALRTLAGPLAAGLYLVELTTANGARRVERALVY
ncbi:MAG: PKD domain-containing protein [Hymenobacteraceae bacterium]|nr:PKD domain-containing protein [Hymenobacteraceae bacterium]